MLARGVQFQEIENHQIWKKEPFYYEVRILYFPNFIKNLYL